MAEERKRIIALTEKAELDASDYLAVDSAEDGTHKVPASAFATVSDLDEIRSRIEVTGTASGAIATFTDGADMPAKSVIVNIEPQQSGTGTPSPDNVRPISGWESVSARVNSMNLFPNTLGVQSVTKNGVTFDITEENGFITDIYMHGTATGSGSLSFATTDNGFQLPKGTLKMYLAGDKTTSGSRFDLNIRRAGASQDIVATTAVVTITNDEVSDFGSAYIYFYNGAVLNHHIMPCIVPNDVDTSEYPKYPIHNATTTTVNLGRTVYGGTLDVVSGVLTVDRAIVDLGTLTWVYVPDYSTSGRAVFRASVRDAKFVNTVSAVSNIVSEKYATSSTSSTIETANCIGGKDTTLWCSTTGQSITPSGRAVYELATPQTYQLTPTEVQTLLGENNVWADAGDVEVVYVRDLNIAINNLLNSNGTRSLGMMAMSAPTKDTAEEPTDEQSDEDMR